MTLNSANTSTVVSQGDITQNESGNASAVNVQDDTENSKVQNNSISCNYAPDEKLAPEKTKIKRQNVTSAPSILDQQYVCQSDEKHEPISNVTVNQPSKSEVTVNQPSKSEISGRSTTSSRGRPRITTRRSKNS